MIIKKFREKISAFQGFLFVIIKNNIIRISRLKYYRVTFSFLNNYERKKNLNPLTSFIVLETFASV